MDPLTSYIIKLISKSSKNRFILNQIKASKNGAELHVHEVCTDSSTLSVR